MMRSDDATSNRAFIGSAVGLVDGKARVTVPAFLRAPLGDESPQAINLGAHPKQPCLLGYGKEYMDTLLDQIRDRGELDEMVTHEERGLFGISERFHLAGDGRITLPGMLRSMANIEDRILFVGCGDTFEMWNPHVALAEGSHQIRSLASYYLNGASSHPRRSSDWTGRFLTSDHARFVKSRIPEALDALDEIITRYESNGHNDAIRPDQEPLQSLRQLHEALGSLLESIDKGKRLDGAFERVRTLATGMWTFGRESGQLLVRGTPALIASVPASYGLILALELIFGAFTNEGRATLGAGVAGGLLAMGHGSDRANARPTPDRS